MKRWMVAWLGAMWLSVAHAAEPPPDGFVEVASYPEAKDRKRASEPVDGLTLRYVVHRGVRFFVATVDTRKVDLKLVGQVDLPRPATFHVLERRMKGEGRELVWGTNAGLFHRGGVPVGLFVQDGVERTPLNTGTGRGNFWLFPNGVFFIDGEGAAVRTTAEVASRGTEGMRLATQSGPMLVRDGRLHHKLNADSPNRLLRSGVGVSDAHTVHFVMSDGVCRFHELATLFRDGLGASDALFLDGTISQWVTPKRRPADDRTGGFGGLFYVETPAAEGG